MATQSASIAIGFPTMVRHYKVEAQGFYYCKCFILSHHTSHIIRKQADSVHITCHQMWYSSSSCCHSNSYRNRQAQTNRTTLLIVYIVEWNTSFVQLHWEHSVLCSISVVFSKCSWVYGDQFITRATKMIYCDAISSPPIMSVPNVKTVFYRSQFTTVNQ